MLKTNIYFLIEDYFFAVRSIKYYVSNFGKSWHKTVCQLDIGRVSKGILPFYWILLFSIINSHLSKST